MNVLAAIFILLIPFSYLAVFGVRLILLQVISGSIFVVFRIMKSGRVRFNSLSIILAVFCCLIFSYSLITRNFTVLLAALVFSFYFFVIMQLPNSATGAAVRLYRFGVTFTAAGVLTQVAIYIFMGVDLFKTQQFGGGRNAFGFIWEDYSFLSLYLTSAIPLFFEKKFDLRFFSFVVFLLLASISTSARTGIAGLIVAISIVLSFYVARVFKSGKINKKILLFVIFIMVTPFFVINVLEGLTGRVVTLASSGRIEDYYYGYTFFLRSPFFGTYFDDELYASSISIIPHNIFIYTAYLGGGLAIIILLTFLLSILLKVKAMDRRLAFSLLVCFIGLQFIPSFFSAYFVSALLGIGILSSKELRSK